MKKTFKPIVGSLEKLTEQERLDYVARLCEHLEVPADLGLVDLGWQDGGDGGRILLPFVRKGAAEIIRSKHGISVTGMNPCNGDGYVAFTVCALDKTGRQEIAVGAVNIKGLSGPKTADAVMWAQTRASRRVTLQFVGGGVLDESELNEKTTDINSASSLKEISVAPQPTVQPNAEAGKDITVEQVQIMKEQITGINAMPADPSKLIVFPPPTEPVKRPRGRPRKNVVSLDSPSSVVPASAVQQTYTTEGAASPAKVAIDSASMSPLVQGAEAATTVQPFVISVSEVSQAELEPIEPPFVGTRCTDEQKAHFRKRRSDYVNDILPKAGFLQSEKLGSRNDKFMLFVQAMFPKSNIKQLSLEQWTHLFSFLDGKVAETGAAELVKFVNKQIGEIDETQVKSA